MNKIWLGMIFFFFGLSPAAACDTQTPCTVAHGYYLVRPPKGWDGKSPLPAAVFFHGYGSSAAETLKDTALGKVFSDADYLLVLPNALEKVWYFPNGATQKRDDFNYVKEVTEDVEKRFPIDKKRFFATGFSIGGSMAWYVACNEGSLFAAYAPFSGAFWEPQPTSCASGPVSLRHVHGLSDTTMPMNGRVINTPAGQLKQGNVLLSIETLRREDGCPEAPARLETVDDMECRVWTAQSCSSGRELRLCLHRGGHELRAEWMASAIHWVDQLAASHKSP